MQFLSLTEQPNESLRVGAVDRLLGLVEFEGQKTISFLKALLFSPEEAADAH